MPYSADTIAHITFDALPLVESAHGLTIISNGDLPTLVAAQFSNGYKMTPKNNLSVNSTAPSGSFTMGFWLTPTNPGMVTNPNTGATEPLYIPVVAQGTFMVSAGSYVFTGPLCIYEQTNSDGTNQINVQVNGLRSALPATGTVSASYATGIPHYFWIEFVVGTSLTIFVDGVQVATTTTSLPTSLYSTASGLLFNYQAPGGTYGVAKNLGVMDDFIFFSTAHATTEAVRAAELGAIYVADTSLATVEEIYQPIVFSDPSTVQINAVFANRSNVFLARDDGKLLRGVRSLWESRRDWSPDELRYVTVVRKSSDNTINFSDDGILSLQKEVIRV